jgi:predicted RNase H-like HicB family nuclease
MPDAESGYVATCDEVAVVTQGETLDEATANLREAVALHLEGEDLAAVGFAAEPTIIVTVELAPTHHR